jgi:hypothetical protein
MTALKAIPVWTGKRWQYNPQHNGVRKSFFSPKPGRAGSIECKHKAADWIESGSHKDRRLRDCWPDYMVDVSARGGTGSIKQRQSYGRNYLLPTLGHKLVQDITDQDWQDIINAASVRGKSGRPLSKKTLQNLRGTITDFCRT